MRKLNLPQGAEIVEEGVRYSIWAPEKRAVDVEIHGDAGAIVRTISLRPTERGYFVGTDPLGRAGDRYKLKVDDGLAFPSPASHWQPEGVSGPSAVIDHRAYRWSDVDWVRPAFRDLVIYELHVGTFTAEGTFEAAIDRLPYLADLGINAIEIMPIADFPGERGWGYDGVQLYAPARCYGHPDDLRKLVDAAHHNGITVILDVVYNHFGPDGNYVRCYSPYYFEGEHKTPWGDAINFGQEQSEEVRAFYKANLHYWMQYFHIDGFRLDATHAIIDRSHPHILAELAQAAADRGGFVIAEDERNEARIITPAQEDGFGFDAVWADDFHHTVEVAIMDASRYKEEFCGELHELTDALNHGWIYRGQETAKTGLARGTECRHIPPERFVFCISNHDQVGNRAFGERLNQLVSPASYLAASALLLLAPYTPMLFQGQEWACSSPFLYFTDHNEELGKLVEQGRREECRFATFAAGQEIPSPQAEQTFLRSKLRWEEIVDGNHSQVLALYKELLRIRRENHVFRPSSRGTFHFADFASGVLAMRINDTQGNWLAVCDLEGGHQGSLQSETCAQLEGAARWDVELSTSEERFGGAVSEVVFDPASQSYAFSSAGLLLLRAT